MLNSRDVFILDAGRTIIQWNGKKANRFKKARGLDISTRIKYEDRNGVATRIAIDQDSEEDSKNKLFWRSLGEEGKITIQDSDVDDDEEFESIIDKNTRMYRFEYNGKIQFIIIRVTKSDEVRKYVMMVHLNDRMPDISILNTKYVYILDSYNEIFVYTLCNVSY